MIVREATPVDAAAIAGVHVDTWRTTYPSIVPDDVLARLSYQERRGRWERVFGDPAGPELVYVAEDEAGQIVGFASAGRSRSADPDYDGELFVLYIRRSHQGKGLGRRLVRAVAERLAASGIQSMLVWVLADNPARRFYEALGGRWLRAQPIDFGSATLDEVAYGWTDTTTLSQPTTRR